MGTETLNTAGTLLSELDVLNYMKCPKLFQYQLKEQKQEQRTEHVLKTNENRFWYLDPETRVAKWFYETLALVAEARPLKDLNYELNKITYKFPDWLLSGYLPQQKEQFYNRGILKLNEVLNTLPLHRYSFVLGPTPLRVRVSKTPILLGVSAVLTTNTSAHIVDFSTHNKRHSYINNYLYKTKTMFYKQYLKQDLVYHVFNLEKDPFYYHYDSKTIKTQDIQIFEQTIKDLETRLLTPLVPCPYKCKFKKRCKINV